MGYLASGFEMINVFADDFNGINFQYKPDKICEEDTIVEDSIHMPFIQQRQIQGLIELVSWYLHTTQYLQN